MLIKIKKSDLIGRIDQNLLILIKSSLNLLNRLALSLGKSKEFVLRVTWKLYKESCLLKKTIEAAIQ